MDNRFQKKMDIKANPHAFSPKYQVKAGDRNLKMIRQQNKLVSCNSSTRTNPVSPRDMISMQSSYVTSSRKKNINSNSTIN